MSLLPWHFPIEYICLCLCLMLASGHQWKSGQCKEDDNLNELTSLVEFIIFASRPHSGGQICNLCMWRHLVAFATNVSEATWWPNVQLALFCGQIDELSPSHGVRFWVRCASRSVLSLFTVVFKVLIWNFSLVRREANILSFFSMSSPKSIQ